MDLDSPARAATDALQSVLKKRLFRKDPEEHRRFIEIECARIVETLRVLRDTYRGYLQPKIDGPLVEMYWVVVRFGIKDWAVMRLRSAMVEYIVAAQIAYADWNELYGVEQMMLLVTDKEKVQAAGKPPYLDRESAKKAIESLVRREVFDEVTLGGPFGKDAQLWFARTYLGIAVMQRRENFPQSVQRRHGKWEACRPWTEGLARLFDSTQEEVLRQFGSLSVDGHKAESAMISLSTFERIAYRHLVSIKNQAPVMPSTDTTWASLVAELDQQQVPLELNLDSRAMTTLSRMRKKGAKISTWLDCLESTAGVTLDDGRIRTLRREMMHSVHNAASHAALRLNKVWGSSDGV